MKLIIHIILRLIGQIALVFIGTELVIKILGLDGSIAGGPGDGLVFFFSVMLFYILGIIILLIESYSFDKKEEIKKRNANLMIVVIPPLIGFIYSRCF